MTVIMEAGQSYFFVPALSCSTNMLVISDLNMGDAKMLLCHCASSAVASLIWLANAVLKHGDKKA